MTDRTNRVINGALDSVRKLAVGPPGPVVRAHPDPSSHQGRSDARTQDRGRGLSEHRWIQFWRMNLDHRWGDAAFE
ncbi:MULTISPECIES: hypothetical protein, partial [Rhodococcus]|uniref:hypothetical protein n=1 Tax=Rhodococcus TaxID=1827 RepID=UPI00295391DA